MTKKRGRKRKHSMMKRMTMGTNIDRVGTWQSQAPRMRNTAETGGRELENISDLTADSNSHILCQTTQALLTATGNQRLKLLQGKEREMRSVLHQLRKDTKRKS